MNQVIITVYLLGFFALAGMTFAFMFKAMENIFELEKKPTKKTKLPAPHPEMEGVRTGEELLVYTPEDEDDDDDDGDIPLYTGENI